MRLRMVLPLTLLVGAVAGCSGGASAPPSTHAASPLSEEDAEAAASVWTTELLARTCVDFIATASPGSEANAVDREVHWARARMGERADRLWVVEVPYRETGGEFAGHSASFYCVIGGAVDEPVPVEWGQAKSASAEQFASYVTGGSVPGFGSGPGGL